MVREEMMKNMVVVLAGAVIMVMLIKGTAAETLTVGDDNGWSFPSSSDFYSSWAAKHTFSVGDTLVFNFMTGHHTVMKVTSKDAFENCTSELNKDAKLYEDGPAEIPLTAAGEAYFICTVGSHCIGGQKLAINVTAASEPVAPTESQSPHDKGSAPSSMAFTFTTISLCSVVLAMAMGYY